MSPFCPYSPGSRVATYLRHSPGEDQTIESQESAVRAWCQQHQLDLSSLFKDEARTGSTTAGRDDFLRMVDWLRQAGNRRPVAGVVLWSYSRFARDYDDAQYYKADLRRRGYIIHSLTDEIPEGRVGRIVEAIIDWKDEERLREIGEDARRGLRWLAEQGYAVGGFPPLGYKRSQATEVGRKKNGEPRLAYRWEIDPEHEQQVRLAWAMKLRGENNWAIHKATRLYKGLNCYPTFFDNLTYAGYRKCRDLQIAGAHPAYVSKEDFDRVQSHRAPPLVQRPTEGEGDPNHPRRRHPGNEFLLTGILFCGTCGAAMVGTQSRGLTCYRCGRKQREGLGSCAQGSIAAHHLHEVVCGWVASSVITMEHLQAARGDLNRALSGPAEDMRLRQTVLQGERDRVSKAIQNLLDGLERVGYTPELETRLNQRKAELRAIEGELADIQRTLQGQAVELSDDALGYLANSLGEALLGGGPDEVRGVLRKVILRADLHPDRLAVQFVPLPLDRAPVPGSLQVYGWCPQGNSNPCRSLERAVS